jgi:hypothetical protein
MVLESENLTVTEMEKSTSTGRGRGRTMDRPWAEPNASVGNSLLEKRREPGIVTVLAKR